MNNIYTIAKKELVEISRSRIFTLTLGLLVVLSVVSLFMAQAVFHDQVTQYNTSLELLKSLGKTPAQAAPELYPLNLLRGVVDYIEIFGAILGIFLGYISVFKEKNAKAIKLILTRPVTQREIIFGKLLGNFIFVFLLMSAISLLIGVSLTLFSGATFLFMDWVKLGIFIALSSFYILIFFTISFFLSFQQKVATNALIISFAIWLVIALIIPQIGDTMDPDNQVPGGFFKSMGLTKDQEYAVMDNFTQYENVRGGIEQLSLTKHYERAMFGFFGVKPQYNGVSMKDIIKDKWGDVTVVISFLLAGLLLNLAFLRRTRNFFEEKQ